MRDSRGSPSFLPSSTRSPRSVRCASSPTCRRSASRLAWRAWHCPSSARSPSHQWCWRSDSRFGARRSRASGIELDAVLPSTGHHPRLMVQHLRSAVREPCNGSPLPPASLGMRKALWDSVATAMDGRPYENTYSWLLQVQGEKIVSCRVDLLPGSDLTLRLLLDNAGWWRRPNKRPPQPTCASRPTHA